MRAEAQRLSQVIGNIISPKAREFMEARRFAIASTLDRNDRVWASILSGQPGFLKAVGESKVSITPNIIPDNSWSDRLADNRSIGILIIDFARRRRLRINGKARLHSTGEIIVNTQQVFFNCPKYIVPRNLEPEAIAETKNASPLRWKLLMSNQP